MIPETQGHKCFGGLNCGYKHDSRHFQVAACPSHLQGAVLPVAADCFYEQERSFPSWRGGVGVGSVWWPERQRRGAELYLPSGKALRSLVSDWPAGSAPLTGVWEAGGKEVVFVDFPPEILSKGAFKT